jgi:Fe-S-cluster containining protein
VADQPDSEPLSELERQVEHGTLFLHAALTEHASRTNQIEAVINGLADLLVRLDVVSTADLVDSVETTRKAIAQAGKQLSLGVAIRGDGESVTIPADEIDCEARIPYCKAVCCRLRFPLTVSEIETGPVKWDLGRPYFNRQEPNGYCHCFDDSSHGCTVYDDRPTPCRQYSCASDERIWKDFEGMVINQEWIDAHLGAERSPIELFMETAEPAAGS